MMELLILFLIGLSIGSSLFWIAHRLKTGGYRVLSEEIVKRGESEAAAKKLAFDLSLREKEFEHRRELEKHADAFQKKCSREEDRLAQRDEKLEARMAQLEKKLSENERKESALTLQKEKLEEGRKELALLKDRVLLELQNLSQMTEGEAKETLLEKVKHQVERDAAHLTLRAQNEAKENAEKDASRIIATAIGRMALPCVSEISVTTVALPNEEMKRRIIGREGRNIRTLEQLIGVNFLIDDTPNAVVISGLDPIRKHIAKTALTELIQDGRIHPTRIEEMVIKAESSVQKEIKALGENAALRAGIISLHPELIALLGKLHFCLSLGQNVLDHSVEVSHLMGLMTSELGLDAAMARRVGLLHDIGKAITHEVEGTHALIGQRVALKYGETQEIANGIGCHHGEIDPITVEGSLCSAADMISGGRPGARNEAVELYFKRIQKLETLCLAFDGVEKAYALQAGREIRVAVLPDKIDDAALVNLARELAKKIQEEIAYPGKIKVTVVRETRAIEYAT